MTRRGLKLTKDAEAGDLRPIVLRMRGENLTPCVPLRLTAIAAAQDMPVWVWVLGDSRAVSTNYHDMVLNDLLTHFSESETYDAILSRALDEVGGRGFVTEYAGSDDAVQSQLDTSQFDTVRLATIDDPIAFVDEMVRQGFVQSRLVLELLREFIPRPDSVPDDVDDYLSLQTPEGLTAAYVSYRAEDFDSLPAALRSYVYDGSGNELAVDRFDDITSLAVNDVPAAISLKDDTFCECGRSDGRSQPGAGGGLCTAAPAAAPRTAGLALLGVILAGLGIVLARRRR